MKKKIFSTLLMGVLFVASVGMFSSCKNYDDDISNLQGQIDKAALKSEVEAMQATLSTTSTNASSALTTAQSALTKANLGVTADQLAAVKTAAENAGKDAATAITNAAAASKAASDAADAAKAAQASADQRISDAVNAQKIQNDDLNQKLIDLGKLVDTKVTADQLNQSLDNLKADIMGNATENLGALQNEVKNYQSSIDALYTAVTGVSLIASYTGNGKEYNTMNNLLLSLQHGLQSVDYKFGDKETYNSSAPIIEYKKGTDIDILFENGVIVKVDPSNAKLDAAKIILVNSEGTDISDIIVAGTPRRYKDMITRSSNITSGLWKIPFHVKAGVTEKQFNEATTDPESGKSILFAVAVNNTNSTPTQAGSADRYVISTYDLAASYKAYQNAHNFTFKVDDRQLTTIHNRWDGSKILADDGATTLTTTNPEKAWVNGVSANDVNDARFSKSLYPVEVGKPFTITLENDSAEYYYVALDKANALESAPSEWNAWYSYDGGKIDGLFKTTKESDKLEITINDPKANGDVIGFRVFAVNYDGTLMDPDGKAFYVQVGNAANIKTIDPAVAEITAKTQTASTIAKLSDPTTSFASFTGSLSGSIVLDQASSAQVAGSATVNYVLCTDATGTPATNWNEAKYVKISYSDAGSVIDGSTLTGSVSALDPSTGRVVNTLSLSVKKVMPTYTTGIFYWIPNQGPNINDDGGTYNCYVDPVSGWNVNSATGSKYFKEAVHYGSLSASDYRWTIAKGVSDTQDLVFAGDAAATVAQAKVNNTTTYVTTLDYLIKGVSCKDVTTTDQNYPEKVWSGFTIFSCALDPNVQTYTPKFEGKITYEQSGFTIKAADYLDGHNAYDNPQFGGAFKKDNYIPDSYVATLTSKTTGNPDYFTVVFDGTTFTFKPQSNTTNPTADVPSTLTVTAKDAFGHTKTIVSLPFTVSRKQ